MNNDTNNQNGMVLGTVNTTPVANGAPEPVETLGTPTNNNVINPEVLNNNTNNTAVTTPPVEPAQPVGQPTPVEQPAPVEPAPQAAPTPVVAPEPAYTNPQAINPKPPVAGFDGSIGTTPPVSLEPEKVPKKKGNKFLFTLLIIVLLIGVGFGTYYILNYTDLLKKKETITVETKELSFNIGDDLPTNISEYATITGTDSKNCSFDTSLVNTQEEGSYTFKVICGSVEKTGTVEVVDNREIEVTLKTVYKKVGSEIEAKEFVEEVDDSYDYEFKDEEDVKTKLSGEAGVYSIPLKISTTSKSTEANGTLVVVKSDVKGFYTCVASSETVSDIKATKEKSLMFVILNDGNNGFGGYAEEKYVFTFTGESDYANYLDEFKTNNVLELSGVTGVPRFDDENKTITFSFDKKSSELETEYGADNIVNYKTLSSYFNTTEGYKCSYKKAE